MDLGISGRVAIITGGSGGIGFATAKLLALEGVKLVLSDRQQADVDDAAGIIAVSYTHLTLPTILLV